MAPGGFWCGRRRGAGAGGLGRAHGALSLWDLGIEASERHGERRGVGVGGDGRVGEVTREPLVSWRRGRENGRDSARGARVRVL